MKKWKRYIGAVFFLLSVFFVPVRANAAQQTIYNSPYVTFSPDGLAWTTNAGDTKYVWYGEGTAVYTGIASELRELEAGEHYYKYRRSGSIPLRKWEVVYRTASCIHSLYTDVENWHGIHFERKICGGRYFSGWNAYCADCGEKISGMLVYMSREAAASIDYLDVGYIDGKMLDYYYLCPWNRNLEMGSGWEAHVCKAVSWNQYKINYDPNTSEIYGGYMVPSIHMYNNETVYEGKTVTPATHLTRNAYTRVGYEFVEWNTEPDGGGTCYEDGAEVLNLTEKEEVITLYAQWRMSRSTLQIDPNNGRYDGRADVSEVEGDYGSRYYLDSRKVEPPAGYTVSFQTNGGSAVGPITGTQHFSEWGQIQPFLGRVRDSYYEFTAPDKNVDAVSARYVLDPIVLPTPQKENSSFGGWYYDSGFTRPAGGGGDTIIPDRDMTLYAHWVELLLTAEDDYASNRGRGAVGLSWTQPDSIGKSYLIYQSVDGTDWKQVSDADDISSRYSVDEVFSYSGQEGTYKAPYTGLYTITAEGAQGGRYNTNAGGRGGLVSAQIWLRAGEIVIYDIGGQDGYNGGGTGNMFADGGGCTVVSTDLKGDILVAGGGGGATSEGDGGAGGSSASLTDESRGESGGAGGGGGYRGGTAGEYIQHFHTTSSDCYHAHRGNSTSGGGCYGTKTTRSEQRTCNPTSRHVGSAQWAHGIGCGGTVTQNHYIYFGTNGCDQTHGRLFSVSCSVCGHLYDDNAQGHAHSFTYTVTEYLLDCGRPSGYSCGYVNGQVVSAKPAYGGSNYVNTEYIGSYSMDIGVRVGDGRLAIKSELIGFVDDMVLNGVSAPDLEAPDAVSPESVKKNALTGGQVQVSWGEPRDNGTTYYHVVESYLSGSAAVLCRSNVTENTLITGVSGYYTWLDQCETTVVTKNSIFTEEPVSNVILQENLQYLHVAATDRAGNCGVTIHIPLEKPDEDLQWPLYTRQLELEEGDNTYPAGERSYYVRSDGVTPFTMNYEAYLDGEARENYQINYAVFETTSRQGTVRNILECASDPVSQESFRIPASHLTLTASGRSFLSPYPLTSAFREAFGSELRVSQAFAIDRAADGLSLEIVPVAGADYRGEIVYSDHIADSRNGITVIADGTGPVIRGMEILENQGLIDRREIDLTLRVTAEDALSGVKDFYLEIYNTDNVIREIYRAGEDGIIKVDITQDEPVFSGDFIVTAYAEDNVGNVTSISEGTTEFALEVDIARILEPHDPIFKSGESGVLTITTWGYAERVEVEFPPELLARNPELNHTYEYTDEPDYRQEESLQFMIPLYVPENENYTVIVRAYKGERKLEEHPALGVIGIQGTVLDEIRTRLR